MTLQSCYIGESQAVARVFDLRTLLQPLEPDAFCREIWEKQARAVSRDDPRYYSSLFSIADIDSLITLTAHASSPHKVRLVKSHNGELVTKSVSNTADGVPDIYTIYRSYHDEGYTLNIDRLDVHWKPISMLCRNLENALHHPTAANLYFTPPSAQGFLPHFDTHDVFVLQLEGSKTWRLYDAVASLPLADSRSTVHLQKLGAPRETIPLKAGDLFYLPRGRVHDAVTGGNASLHLTIGVHVFRWADLIGEAMKSAAERCRLFREALPVAFLDDEEFASSLKTKMCEVLAGVDPQADAEFAVGRLAQRLLTNGQPLPDGHFVSIAKLDDLTLDSLLARRMSCRIVAKDDSVSLQYPGNIISGPIEILPALEFIRVSEEFAVSELPGLTDEDKLLLASRLVREGLLAMRAVSQAGVP
jgi:ribosomal protein L16 Arg81 hydroxylase